MNKYIEFNEYKISGVFTTGEENRDYHRWTENGQHDLKLIKEEFNVDDVKYLKQTHTDKVVIIDDANQDVRDIEADALVTNLKNIIIGVFNADCVPVLIYSKEGVVAAIHSGWKGTLNGIVKNTIEIMINDFNVSKDTIKVKIGPHIRKCCYEVSEELIEKFNQSPLYKNKKINYGRMLDLGACINEQLNIIGINEENIEDYNLCTCCNKDIHFHSYRRDGKDCGRLFSFIYIR